MADLIALGGKICEGSALSPQDTGNIVCLEHINIDIPEQDYAIEFYVAGLGLTRDPYLRTTASGTAWVNIGTQQFHLPRRSPAQVIAGRVTIVLPCLKDLVGRLQNVSKFLTDTKFTFTESKDETGVAIVDCTGPYGNSFRVYQHGAEAAVWGSSVERPHQMGIAALTLAVPPGTAQAIAEFYVRTLGAYASVSSKDGLKSARVRCGPAQELCFTETHEDCPPYDGYHVAIYVANFTAAYENCVKLGVAWNNPRFSDIVHSVDDALSFRQFRFKDIIILGSDKRVLELEHEVRSLGHEAFMRPLANKMGTRV